MRISLRYRLLFPIAVLLLADVALTYWAASEAARNAEVRVAQQLDAVKRTLTEPPTFPLAPRVLEQMSTLSGAEFALHTRGGNWITTFKDVQRPGEFLQRGEQPVVQIGPEEYRVQQLLLQTSHPNAGDTLYICYSESLRQTAVRDAVRPTLLLGFIGGLVGCSLTLLVSSRLVWRIRALQQRTQAIASGERQPMPIPRQQDEIQDLVRAVNEMSRRLDEYEQQLKANERLQILGQFSGGLAHQLRNAAGGAKLAIQLVLADAAHDQREPLEVALRQLARIEQSLKQFLDLGRPPPLNQVACDLGEILKQTVDSFRARCIHAGVTLRCQWTGPLPFRGDETQLSHLFSNLIGNAIDAVTQGGEVEVQVKLSDTKDEYYVTVMDNGSGPPPEIADRLFDAFVTGKAQGVGLGLAIAKKAVEAHGGLIRWNRNNGKTRFVVSLPI